MNWIQLAGKLDWLSPADRKKAYQNVGEVLTKGFKDQSNRDLFYSILDQNDEFGMSLKDDPKVANSLVDALKDQKANVRENAADALGAIKPTDRAMKDAMKKAGMTVDW